MHQRLGHRVSEIEPLPHLMRRMDWNHLKAFLAVAECGSVRRAATRLAVGAATVTRHVADLEIALNAKLFHRTPNAVQLTDEGARILDAVRKIEHQVYSIGQAASGAADQVAGRIMLSTTDGLGTFWLPHFMSGLRDTHPHLQLDLSCDMRHADVLRHEADISVQYLEPTNADLVCKVIGHLHVWLYAARGYAENHNLPTSLVELRTHPLIIQAADQLSVKHFTDTIGVPLDELDYTLTRSSTSHYEMIRSGIGIGVLPTYLAFDNPDLVPVNIFVDYSLPIRLCYHEQQRNVARVRAVIDWLQDVFSPSKHPFFAKQNLTPADLASLKTPPLGVAGLSGSVQSTAVDSISKIG